MQKASLPITLLQCVLNICFICSFKEINNGDYEAAVLDVEDYFVLVGNEVCSKLCERQCSGTDIVKICNLPET